MGLFPRNYWEDEQDVHLYPSTPPARTGKQIVTDLQAAMDRILERNPCEIGLSPDCARVDDYLFKGKKCCGYCQTFVERALKAAADVLKSKQVRR
jgi:hypothetical protein